MSKEYVPLISADPKNWPAFVSEWFTQMEEAKDEEGAPEYECMDNYRAINMISPTKEAAKAYQEQQEKGCCGSVEKTISDGKEIWRVGFNYGH